MDSTVLCPVFDFITLACARQAFEITDMNSPEKLFGLKVTGTTPYMEIPFKPEVLDTPICRGLNGKPMSYSAISRMLKNGGLHAGFAKGVTCYWLRRGASNAISHVATPAELTQIMGHTSQQMFSDYYADKKIRIDTQAAFVGTAPQSEILDALRRLERDPAAPCKLDKFQAKKIWADDEVLGGLLRDRSGAKNDSEASRTLDLLIKSRKEKLSSDGAIQLRAEWFKSRSSREIRQQLAGVEPPLHVEERTYLSDRHRSLVESIFDSLSTSYRPNIISELIQFCLRDTTSEHVVKPDPQPASMAYLPDANESKLELIWEDSIVHEEIPKSVACPFCSIKTSTRGNLNRHVLSKHLARTITIPVQCPCGIQCSKLGIFKNHLALHHGIRLSPGNRG
jgi:hypothetical protein